MEFMIDDSPIDMHEIDISDGTGSPITQESSIFDIELDDIDISEPTCSSASARAERVKRAYKEYMKPTSLECALCGKTFSRRKNVYQHLRKTHNICPEIPGHMECPLSCNRKFRTHKELRSHLEAYHDQLLEKEELQFPDIEAFNEWKKNLEVTTGYGYSCRISPKVMRKGEIKMHLICHRSGIYKSESKGIRRTIKSSNKIGSVCPSVMEVTRSLESGRISVIFYKTHLGHTADVERALRNIRSVTRVKKSSLEGRLRLRVCAVIPAAGIGSRTGLDIPKQYITIHYKSIVCHTVEAFLRIPWIYKVVVVVDDLIQMLPIIREQCDLNGDRLVITEGSTSRHRSIANGVRALETCCKSPPQIVVIHDGVRPTFSEDVLLSVILSAKQHGAAGVTCPLVSTVISVNSDGFLDTSLNRNKYLASEMPQAFIYKFITQAYEKCSEFDLDNGTECLELIQNYCNIRAKLVTGNSSLWKITHRKDVYSVAAVLKENQDVWVLGVQQSSELFLQLKKSLLKSFQKVNLANSAANLDGCSNIIHAQNFKNPFDFLDDLGKETTVQYTSQVHILRDFDTNINLIEFQRQFQAVAKILAEHKVLIYIILCEYSDDTLPVEKMTELSELSRSVLFDSNPSLTGSIYFCLKE